MKPFKDPIAPKARKVDKNFVAPTKEQATTGKFMAPGDDYGVGFRTPVGTLKESSKEVIPMKSKCFYPDDVI